MSDPCTYLRLHAAMPGGRLVHETSSPEDRMNNYGYGLWLLVAVNTAVVTGSALPDAREG